MGGNENQVTGSGLIVHRGSRVDRLAEQLAIHLEDSAPENPLVPQSVVVAHQGLRRWLLGEFARRRGPRGSAGIAANFDMILPWQWLERAARRTLGDEALVGGPYRREVLRWHILAALPTLSAREIRQYLAGDDAARRGYQLAEHLAGVFTQYLIYRPDWILGWEQAANARAEDDWQATLWQRVQAAIGRPHRAQRAGALVQRLADGADAGRDALHVFGVSHLPPDILGALRASALHRAVHLYFPDPCREHWVYLRRQRDLLKQDSDPEALYFEVGHPLLVALGRIAQDFCLALDSIEATEQRDALDDDEEDGDAQPALLARLQSSIRCMQPEWVGAPFRDAVARGADRANTLRALREDASLRVHVCHTRLRELEVLKDALLRCLADDPTLDHRDIVVMAPDIGAYAACLGAVFGEPVKYRADPLHLPWHLADVGLASTHPLIATFGRVLDLAESRFTVSDVLAFLDSPAVARRFEIDAADREMLERWLERAHVAWGLDAAMKQEAGAAPVDAHSWQFGFDRLFAGFIAGADAGHTLLDGVLPLDGVSGSGVEALGQLDRLLAELRRIRGECQRPRCLSAWSEWLLARMQALFEIDARDDAEVAAFDALRRSVASLAIQADEARLREVLPWGVVREALRDALAGVPERQAFLLGGVTFCGLVPQRSIPFRVVCLIGMNEGEFPRIGGDAGLNRMIAQPRHGDRDTRNEDRYLFLEALMAARERLHISYIGVGVGDGKPRNPASPLAELLQFLDEQYDLADAGSDDGNRPLRPWRVRHPLQPFDARYYERDADGQPAHGPALFSYDASFVEDIVPAPVQDRRFIDPAPNRAAPNGAMPISVQTPIRADAPVTDEVSLATLARFWRDPARHMLLRNAGLSLEALDESDWPDREPLDTRVAAIERLDRRLLFDALLSGADEVPADMPPWLALSGALADGAIGAESYATLRASAERALVATRGQFPSAKAERMPQAIDLDLGDGLRVSGRIDRVFRAAGGKLLLFDAKPNGQADFGHLLPFHIDWALLRLSLGDRIEAEFLERTGASGGNVAVAPPALLPAMLQQDDRQLREGLRRLIVAAAGADHTPLLFFPRTAWAYAINPAPKRIREARTQWNGGAFGHPFGERNITPGYAALLARDLDFLDGQSPAFAAFAAAVELVAAVLDPQRSVLFKAAAEDDA